MLRTSQRGRLTSCGQCVPCRREDCKKCTYCLDKPSHGGGNILRQRCIHKRCVKKRPSNMSVLPKKGALTNRKRKRPDKHEPVQKNKRRKVNASGTSVTSNVKVVRRRRVRNKRGDLVTRAELAKGKNSKARKPLPRKGTRTARSSLRNAEIERTSILMDGPKYKALFATMVDCYKAERGYSQSKSVFSLRMLPPIEDELPINDGFVMDGELDDSVLEFDELENHYNDLGVQSIKQGYSSSSDDNSAFTSTKVRNPRTSKLIDCNKENQSSSDNYSKFAPEEDEEGIIVTHMEPLEDRKINRITRSSGKGKGFVHSYLMNRTRRNWRQGRLSVNNPARTGTWMRHRQGVGNVHGHSRFLRRNKNVHDSDDASSPRGFGNAFPTGDGSESDFDVEFKKYLKTEGTDVKTLMKIPDDSQGVRLSTVVDLNSPSNSKVHTEDEDTNNNAINQNGLLHDVMSQSRSNDISAEDQIYEHMGSDDLDLPSRSNLPKCSSVDTASTSNKPTRTPIPGWTLAPSCEQFCQDNEEVYFFDFAVSEFERKPGLDATM